MQQFGSAFTLIEVLVALVIVAISLVGLIRLNLISIRMTEAAEISSQAVLLANEKIAETLAHGYPEEGTKAGSVEKNALCLNWRTEVTNIDPPHPDELDITGLRRIYVDYREKKVWKNRFYLSRNSNSCSNNRSNYRDGIRQLFRGIEVGPGMQDKDSSFSGKSGSIGADGPADTLLLCRFSQRIQIS